MTDPAPPHVRLLTPDDVLAARVRLEGRVIHTPVLELPGDDVRLHLEYLQFGGTVKYRGAMNRLLAALETGPVRRVAVASSGNAAVATAAAAQTLGLPVRVYTPNNTPTHKVIRLSKLGAEVVPVTNGFPEAYEAARTEATVEGTVFVHPYDDRDLCAGNGTVAFDLVEGARGRVDTVLVAVAGGGVMAGVAMGLRAAGLEGTSVVGVETEGCPTLTNALAAGRPVEVPVSGIAADGLGAPWLGDIGFAVARECGVRSVLVGDEDVVAAREELFTQRRILIEYGTAAAYAALLSGAYRPEPGERVVVLLCGANTSRE